MGTLELDVCPECPPGHWVPTYLVQPQHLGSLPTKAMSDPGLGVGCISFWCVWVSWMGHCSSQPVPGWKVSLGWEPVGLRPHPGFPKAALPVPLLRWIP